VIDWQPKTSEPNELDIKQWILMVGRQWATVAIAVCIALWICLLVILLTPPRYIAEAALALNVRKIQVLQPLETVVSQLPQESPTLRTELDVITSRSMGERVLDALDAMPLLANQSEPVEPPWWLAVIHSPRALLESLFPKQSEVAPAKLRAQRVDQLMNGIKTTNDGHSYTIFLDYTATDPEYAARAANAYADAYLAQQVDLQEKVTVRANEWLRGKLDDLRTKLAASETAAEDFRRTKRLFEANGTSLQAQRMAALSAEIASARAARAGAEARLATAVELTKSRDGLETLTEMLNSPTIQNLRKDEAQIARSVLEIEQAGALKSSELPLLRSQLDSIRAKIDEEVQRHLESLRNEVTIAQRKEQELDATLSRMESAFADATRAMVQLKQLEREANSNKAIYEAYLNRYNQTLEQQGFASPDATVITRAEPPSHASNGRTPILMLGLLGGLGAGFAVAIFRNNLDDRVRSGRLLEQRTGVPILGRIPELPRKSAVPPQQQPAKMPHTPYSHAVRKLATTLSLSPVMMNGPKVIVITSSVPDEGKSTLCASLARSMAITGHRVVVLDCDLRNPSVARTFGVADGAGMRDLVNGAALYEDIDQRDTLTKSHFISVGRSPTTDDWRLIGSDGFRSLVADLRLNYEIIVVDAPPVLASADTALVTSFADATFFVARWGQTTYSEVASSLRQLALCGSPVSGLILQRIDSNLFIHYETGNQPHPKYSGLNMASKGPVQADARKIEARPAKGRTAQNEASLSRKQTERS
jgi:capsular exopolysaccharide synthesis family protein